MTENSIIFDIRLLIKFIKRFFLLFSAITILLVSIPIFIYLNAKTKYTSVITIEPQNSIKLLQFEKIWIKFHEASEIIVPFAHITDSATDSEFSRRIFSEFIFNIKSSVNLSRIYQTFVKEKNSNLEFYDISNNIEFTRDVRNERFIISYSAIDKEHSSSFLNYFVNQSYLDFETQMMEVLDNLIYVVNLSQGKKITTLNIDKVMIEKYSQFKDKNQLKLVNFNLDIIRTEVDKFNLINSFIAFIIISIIINFVILMLLVKFVKRIN